MRTFSCGHCGQLVFFENVHCLRCGWELGFDVARRELRALAWEGGVLRSPEPAEAGWGWLRCANAAMAACNWLVPITAGGGYCFSCALTRTRPHDQDPAGQTALALAEAAKRRLVFQLLELGLPVESHAERQGGLAFDLLWPHGEPVVTGHDEGVITIDLSESDSARRERLRVDLGEPYRTLLGHFRHEIGHYYWDALVPAQERDAFRALFGDESVDYAGALEQYYAQGAPAGWQERYVSEYATMHPFEDWAESFSHYLHMGDVLQTAASFRLSVTLPGANPEPAAAEPGAATADFERMRDAWVPVSLALNAVNRSMGKDDLYPFAVAPAAMEKLRYVHERIARCASPPG